MDWRSVTFDWNRARAFLVTAEEGSLSAAARALGLSQPTLGRQVRALEGDLGVVLFERAGHGLMLTPAGLEIVEHIRTMGQAASGVSRVASGQSNSIEGTIRITATEVAAAYVLPPIIADLRRAAPGLAIEVVATNAIRDLRRREADIAIRAARPVDPELIARRLDDGSASLFAATEYLAAHGPFEGPEDLAGADFIGFDENADFVDALNAMGLNLRTGNFPVSTANHLVQWQMVRAGLGIGVMIDTVGDADPSVARAAPFLAPFSFPVWLVAHRDLTNSRKMRLVFDHLAAALGS